MILGFRPEDVEDAALTPASADGASLSVVAEIREDMGSEVYVHFGLGVPPVRRREVAEAREPEEPTDDRVLARDTSPFVARLGRETRAKEGGRLELAVDVDRLYLFGVESGDRLDAA